MPPKSKSVFVCSECGFESSKWVGKCTTCGAWNSLIEEIRLPEKSTSLSSKASQTDNSFSKTIKLTDITAESEKRILTGINELDRVLGGGIVPGSLVLISGEPGIGKSTVLLQMCAALCRSMDILYVSGEESPRQLRLRAERLNVMTERLFILNETNMDSICTRVETTKPSLVIIDSIQTMYREDISSSPGSVSQVRECTAKFMNLSKGNDIPIFIVGHVNKEGSIAGPKVMEHMVDAVLYFEGERTLDCRILRAVKNRFGSTNEIGVFEMTERGLEEVENPSLLFLQGKPENVSGIATVGIMEGSRPLVAEVQALVTQTPFPAPRRMAAGFDYNRLNLLIAVLEKRCGMFFGTSDAYLNVIG
ncbi:MAG: radA, partial [Clostridia bacterium]|nr:radA [Clostridia bacterium]